MVTNDKNRIIPVQFWQLDNKIHGNQLPWTLRDVEGLEKTVGLVTWDLDLITSVASSNIVAKICIDTRPQIITHNSVNG